MLSKTILSLYFLVASATAAAQAFSAADAPKAFEKLCKQGCVILDDQGVERLLSEFGEIVDKQTEFAFKAGVLKGFESAKDNPKICPRNV